MPRTNSWLCQYSICQLGRPYWYATSGQISSESLYENQVRPAILRDLGSYCVYSDYTSQLNVKVHDCSGLIVGALTCDSVNGEPTGSSPIYHGATSQFNNDCDTTSETMSNFPYLPGTLVFHTNGEYKSHVGIYVGDFIDADGNSHSNAVVEAMGHNWGVTTTDISNDKWDAWGQLSCCTVDTVKGQKFDVRNVLLGNASGNAQSMINVQAMTPFVATILPGYKLKLDYDRIKSARISAMMFFAGELYDAHHNKGTYVNPQLADLVQQCNSHGMKYALYVNVRAKNEIEADAECRALYYVVSRFSPALGLWLSLQTHNLPDMNDKVLEVYYKYIDRWGLKARCGLYISKEQLNKFSWSSFQNRFYLWLIDPMEVSKVDDELLQPEMFEVSD